MVITKNQIIKLISDFLEGKTAATRRVYQSDLQHFSSYLKLDKPVEALLILLNRPSTQSELTVLHYRAHLVERGESIATINRRLSTIRSFVRQSKASGLLNWTLDVQNLQPQEGLELGRKTISEGDARRIQSFVKRMKPTKKTIRDIAILLLILELSLKRSDVAGLRLDDVDTTRGKIRLRHPKECEYLRLPISVNNALKLWINRRGKESGPLFTNFDHAQKSSGLSATSVYRIVRRLGEKAGVKLSPERARWKSDPI